MHKLMINLLPVACLIATTCLVSCSDKKESEPESPMPSNVTITVNPESFTVGYDKSEQTLMVKSTADWNISAEADWVSLTPKGGSKDQETTIKVKFDANGGATARTTNIIVKSSGKSATIPVTQESRPTLNLSASSVSFGAQASSFKVEVEANSDWTASSDADWLKVTPTSGTADDTLISLSAELNSTSTSRKATVTVKSGELTKEIAVEQYTDEITTPEGYSLVWHDEFNVPNGSMVDTNLWYYDDWAPGYVNNELQRYVPGKLGNEYTAIIEDGILNIIARKYGSQVISARINTRELWTYGYFEARLKLPKGKGTWPAFWMMPANGGNWPHCGEIDIMEEVGVNPNYTSSSIHCTSYNHVIGTQKTAERYTAGAEEEFHIYALEWTPEYIKTYVDGQQLLYFPNDNKGDENSWPFNKPFHPILNLAWGGDWGGWNGVDDSALPATYQIDYVRIFQKK